MNMLHTTDWHLFLDDLRMPPEDGKSWSVARSSSEAIAKTNSYGIPAYMSLDHDLGGDDTSMVYLKWLADHIGDHYEIPKYRIHSANPVGAKNIEAFMDSWKRSRDL